MLYAAIGITKSRFRVTGVTTAIFAADACTH